VRVAGGVRDAESLTSRKSGGGSGGQLLQHTRSLVCAAQRRMYRCCALRATSCALRAPPVCAAPVPAAAETCTRASPSPLTHGGGGGARGCCSRGVGEAHARSPRLGAVSTGGRRVTRSTGAQEHRSTAIVAATLRSAAEFLYVCRTCSRVRPRTGRSMRRQAKEFYARRCVYPSLPPPT